MKNDKAARILELREAGLTATPEELEARKQAALDRHAAVRDLHNQGLSRRQIAERLGCSKSTVDRALLIPKGGRPPWHDDVYPSLPWPDKPGYVAFAAAIERWVRGQTA